MARCSFHDPNEMPPYRGIKHFYGIYDQSVTFQKRFTKYMTKKEIEEEKKSLSDRFQIPVINPFTESDRLADIVISTVK